MTGEVFCMISVLWMYCILFHGLAYVLPSGLKGVCIPLMLRGLSYKRQSPLVVELSISSRLSFLSYCIWYVCVYNYEGFLMNQPFNHCRIPLFASSNVSCLMLMFPPQLLSVCFIFPHPFTLKVFVSLILKCILEFPLLLSRNELN